MDGRRWDGKNYRIKKSTHSSCWSAKIRDIIRMFSIGYLFLFPISSFADEDKSQRGIYLGTTHVVFDSIGQVAVFTKNNSSSNGTWLIRSWVSPYEKKRRRMFLFNAYDFEYALSCFITFSVSRMHAECGSYCLIAYLVMGVISYQLECEKLY